jgi:PilZ domain
MTEPTLVRPVEGQKRAHERYEVTISVDCTTQQFFVSNHVCNVSRGGLFIRSDKPLPLESEVSLVPSAAQGRPLHSCDGTRGLELRHCEGNEPYRAGVGDPLRRHDRVRPGGSRAYLKGLAERRES